MRQFPSQVVNDVEKISFEYGLKIAQAIESEWFDQDGYSNRYINNNKWTLAGCHNYYILIYIL